MTRCSVESPDLLFFVGGGGGWDLNFPTVLPAVEVQSPNHWTAREVPKALTGLTLPRAFFDLLGIGYVSLKGYPTVNLLISCLRFQIPGQPCRQCIQQGRRFHLSYSLLYPQHLEHSTPHMGQSH